MPTLVIVRAGGWALATMVLTPIWLFLVYVDWSNANVDLALAAKSFHAWPWLKGSMILSTWTFLFPFFSYVANAHGRREFGEDILAYALGFLWIPLLVMYPGTEALGVVSDGRLGLAIFPICLIHYLGARMIANEIQMWALTE